MGACGLALTFSRPVDRFAGLHTETGPYGLPLLSGTVATLICRRKQLIGAGDHLVLVGEALEYRTADGAPLLFLDGELCAGPATHRARWPAPEDHRPAARDQRSGVPFMAGNAG